MKKLWAPIIISLIAFFIASNGYCQDAKVRFYFGNGVFNDSGQATDSLIFLKAMIKNSELQGDLKDRIVTEVSHNPTDGIQDLYEAAIQTHDLAWSSFWRILGGLESMPEFIQDGLQIISARFDEEMVKSYPSIQKHVKKYNEDLCRGDKVIVVAHSQGNLYANIAYKGINKNVIDGFGIVSVANPSWYIADDDSNSYYTTIDEDLVIGFIPIALGSNVNNFSGLNPNDLSGHMFIKSYLAPGLEAESQILDHIITRIYTLEWPEGSCFGPWLSVKYKSWLVGAFDQYFIWDLGKNELAKIKNDFGQSVTFPCVYNDIIPFSREKTRKTAPALSITFNNLGSYTLGSRVPYKFDGHLWDSPYSSYPYPTIREEGTACSVRTNTYISQGSETIGSTTKTWDLSFLCELWNTSRNIRRDENQTVEYLSNAFSAATLTSRTNISETHTEETTAFFQQTLTHLGNRYFGYCGAPKGTSITVSEYIELQSTGASVFIPPLSLNFLKRDLEFTTDGIDTYPLEYTNSIDIYKNLSYNRKAGGVCGSNYLVAFSAISTYIKTKMVRIVNSAYLEEEEPTYEIIRPLILKAVSGKDENDAMNINPFTAVENLALSNQMKLLKEYTDNLYGESTSTNFIMEILE